MTATRIMNSTIASLLLIFSSIVIALPYRINFSQRTDVAAFIDEMVQLHHFDKTKLQNLFNKVALQATVLQKMTRPFEAQSWRVYKPYFVSDDRASDGLAFMHQHAQTLKRATKRFGVPEKIIVAIIGVETRYGKRQGHFRVIDTLSTLAFNYPPRSHYFRRELGQYLLLCREYQLDPLSILGSYAGAIGKPQFMPSSFRAYAVNFAGKGKIDLWNNDADVIASIANFLSQHNWHQGAPIIEKVTVDPKKINKLKNYMALNANQLADYSIHTKHSLKKDATVHLLNLADAKKMQSWLTFHNFSVIRRYNKSKLYAMAVVELSEKIAALEKKQPASNNKDDEKNNHNKPHQLTHRVHHATP